jgi:endonuclease YncB( thermonuclease family)
MRHILIIALAVAVGGALGFLAAAPAMHPAGATSPADFVLCHTGGGTHCVVDGDTIWIAGEKVRIADIDAPETHPPRCAREADLGRRATQRLQAMLNAGAVTLSDEGRDRYGRKLAVVSRDGRSLGQALVAEGLARPWDGRRRPWCDAQA